MHRKVVGGLITAMVLVCAATAARADTVTFVGSSSRLAARADFESIGDTLCVTLQNTSSYDVLAPADVLTAIFWNYDGSPLALSATSAVLGNGSTVINMKTAGPGPVDPGNVVGGEFAYRGNIAADWRYGISSVGLGGALDFGPIAYRFPGSNLQDPDSPDGLQYGIIPAADNIATGNGAVLRDNLIRDTVVFTLRGLQPDFRLSGLRDVYFLYGTSYGEASVPGEPKDPPASPVPLPPSIYAGSALLAAVAFKRLRPARR